MSQVCGYNFPNRTFLFQTLTEDSLDHNHILNLSLHIDLRENTPLFILKSRPPQKESLLGFLLVSFGELLQRSKIFHKPIFSIIDFLLTFLDRNHELSLASLPSPQQPQAFGRRRLYRRTFHYHSPRNACRTSSGKASQARGLEERAWIQSDWKGYH
jgi:hypothetical protein